MTLPKGSIEILKVTREKQPLSFSDYTEIEIDGENLSSATVNKRLKELTALDALEETVKRSDTGRKTVGYEITERGEKIIEISDEFNEKLDNLE